MFYAAVLAGGKSSRMGQDKARLVLGGQSLLDRSVALLQSAGAELVLIGGGGKGGAAPRQAHAHDLGQAVHGVGGIQALTAACPGARPGLASVELLLRYLSGSVTPHRLEGVPDKGCPLAPVPACHHRPSRDDYGGYVEAGRGHQHSRGYLVAIGEQHEAVKGVPLRNGLHHVGYQLP